MKKTKGFVIIIILAVLVICSTAKSDGQGTDEKIAKLEQMLIQMQQELNTLKAQQAQTAQQQVEISLQMESTKTAFAEGSLAIPDWVKNGRIFGELTYRHEWSDDESRVADRNRHRINARIGYETKINDEVKVAIQIATGSDDKPTSTNQDLTGGSSKKQIWLNLAYFEYSPAQIAGLKILGGKIKNPYYKPGNSDLMFDNDVNPEGIAAVFNKAYEQTEVSVVLGGFYLEERSTDADTSLWGIQTKLKHNFESDNKMYVSAGAGYYDYGNTKGKAALGSTATEFYGNSNANNLYTSDYDLAQLFGEFGFNAGKLPIVFFGDYINNTKADSGKDTAYLFGVKLGKCKEPGSWDFSYNYRDVEADAIIGALAESTFAGGGTDIKGHKFCLTYQLMKNFQFAVGYMPGERTRNNTTTDFDVVLIDLKYKF